jgi:hypothetical protein
LAEADAEIAGVVFGLEKGLELDEGEEAEEQGGADADGGEDDPADNGVFFGGAGHEFF